jgi:uncharacterized damage-inducible protein DinB
MADRRGCRRTGAAVVRSRRFRVLFTIELLQALDTNIATGRAALAAASDSDLAAIIPALAMTRVALLRERVMNHLVHHRGQLSVYLRLLDVAVPGMYGPSADEK